MGLRHYIIAVSLINVLIHNFKENHYEEKAINFYNQIVNIPCSTNLENEDIKRVVETIKNYEECC